MACSIVGMLLLAVYVRMESNTIKDRKQACLVLKFFALYLSCQVFLSIYG